MTAAYGHRARIALILPADNVVMEPELADLHIDGVSFHALRLTAITPVEMRAQALDLAAAVGEMGADLVVYACAETSFNGGDEVRSSMSGLIAQRGGVPVVTATEAMLAALAELGVSRPAVFTPYTDVSGSLFVQTLTAEGFDVVRAVHHDFKTDGDDPRDWFLTNRVHPDRILDYARDALHPGADVLVLAATNIPTLAVLTALEAEAGVPVVTSNQSIVWWALRRAGLTADLPRLGALLAPSAGAVPA